MSPRVLLLAGTTEATRLAGELVAAGIDVVSSLAGVTERPVPRAGRVRSGGFGGVDGLARHLRDERVDAIVDATHPFAAIMPFHVVEAAAAVGVPTCRLLRPAWDAVPGDRWVHVPDVPAAADAVVALDAQRVFLAVGRQGLAPFAVLRDRWLLVRSIEPAPLRADHVVAIEARGPFDLDDERALLVDHRIDVIVAKNAGGSATIAKLTAARDLGLTVVMVDRPPAPPGARTVPSVATALAWTLEQVAPSG